MAKSGKSHFYGRKRMESPKKRKDDRVVSHDHARKVFFKQIFAMKFAGKSDKEIMEWLNSQIEGENK